MKIDGCCHCGNIQYEAEVDPAGVVICHCTDCQTLSGSALRTVVPTIEGTFRLLSGAPKVYVKTGESGNKREQTFCPDCGTPIYSAPGGGPKVVGLRSSQAWLQQLPTIMVSADSFFTSRRDRIVALAARYRLPASYPWPQYAEVGGLISYGATLIWAYDQMGLYASRILKGAKPNDLPVQLPTKYELVINLKTAPDHTASRGRPDPQRPRRDRHGAWALSGRARSRIAPLS
jgi:hypothetical protein